MKTLAAIIAEQPFFRGLSPEHLPVLAECAMQTWFESDELIYHDGDLANRFYLIIEGTVALESSVKNGDAVVLQTLGRGDLLGWSWLFHPRLAVARAPPNLQRRFSLQYPVCASTAKPTTTSATTYSKGFQVMMQRLRITSRFLDHLAECNAAPGAGTYCRTRQIFDD
jgi:CRP-like cAMP-binding protein